jgi:sugar phosphate permease
LLVVVLLVWGFTVVADSAQFSASISELSPPEYVGTALTIQTGLGFLLTLGSIQIVPILVDASGWSVAFVALAVGPALGTVAMLRLRATPDALKLAGGRR